jgi:hypothetical protein
VNHPVTDPSSRPPPILTVGQTSFIPGADVVYYESRKGEIQIRLIKMWSTSEKSSYTMGGRTIDEARATDKMYCC